MTTRRRKLFPKIQSKYGGYSVKIHFPDEDRGERYFDTEWDVSTRKENASYKFAIQRPMDFRGEIDLDQRPADSIGNDLRVGETITVHVTRWNTRGRTHVGSHLIRITGLHQNRDGSGIVEVRWAFA